MSFSVHVSISDFFTIRQKRIRGGGAFSEGTSASFKQPLCQCDTSFGARQYAYSVQLAKHIHTHTWCTLSCTAAGRQGGREEAMRDGGRGARAGEGMEEGKLQGRYLD